MAAHERPHETAENKEPQPQLGGRLADVVVAAHEQQRKGLDPGKEEVAKRGADDQQQIRRNREDVPHRAHESERARILLQDQPRVGLNATAPRGHPRGLLWSPTWLIVPLFGLGPRMALAPRRREQLDRSRLKAALPTPLWLGHRPPQRPREEESRNRQQNERRPPGEGAGHDPAEGEACGGAHCFAREDVRPDTPSLSAGKVVAGQGRNRRPGRGGDRAQGEAGDQQVSVAPGERAQQRGDAPEHDARRQQRDPPDAVDQQSDRDDEHRADQQRHGAQQPDLGVADAQRALELRRHRAYRRRIRAAERQHAGEHDDDARACGTTDKLDHFASRAAGNPRQRANKRATDGSHRSSNAGGRVARATAPRRSAAALRRRSDR